MTRFRTKLMIAGTAVALAAGSLATTGVAQASHGSDDPPHHDARDDHGRHHHHHHRGHDDRPTDDHGHDR
jgi:hypothetical protein